MTRMAIVLKTNLPYILTQAKANLVIFGNT